MYLYCTSIKLSIKFLFTLYANLKYRKLYVAQEFMSNINVYRCTLKQQFCSTYNLPVPNTG